MANKKKGFIRPQIPDIFFKGKIVGYHFYQITRDHNKFCIRFMLYFEDGSSIFRQKGGFKKKSEAEIYKKELTIQLQNNTFIPFNVTIKDFFNYWLYYYLIDEKKISYNTYVSYRNVLRYLFSSIQENKLLKNITEEDIQLFFSNIPHKSVLKLAYTVISSSFSFAQKNSFIVQNISISAIYHFKLAEKNKALFTYFNNPERETELLKPKFSILTANQAGILLKTCKDFCPDIFIALLLSLTAGLRISEAIGVKYTDIDFQNNVLHVSRQLGRAFENDDVHLGNLMTQEQKPKTQRSDRYIPLASFVIDEIKFSQVKYMEDKKKDPGFHDLGYITHMISGFPCAKNYVYKKYLKIFDKCNIDYIKWHDLRHTYATLLANDGVSMKSISIFLGHTSEKFSKEVYVYPTKTIYDVSDVTAAFFEKVRPVDSSKTILTYKISDDIIQELLPDQ